VCQDLIRVGGGEEVVVRCLDELEALERIVLFLDDEDVD
jgi:hypothetical protein